MNILYCIYASYRVLLQLLLIVYLYSILLLTQEIFNISKDNNTTSTTSTSGSVLEVPNVNKDQNNKKIKVVKANTITDIKPIYKTKGLKRTLQEDQDISYTAIVAISMIVILVFFFLNSHRSNILPLLLLSILFYIFLIFLPTIQQIKQLTYLICSLYI